MPATFCNLLYHIVFSTKDRRRLLPVELQPRMWAYLGGAIRDEGGVAIAINGMEDHVHLLAKLRQDESLSNILRQIKANSSKWMHETFPGTEDFRWQTGYGAFSVSPSQSQQVQEYIEDQSKHHLKRTFHEEYVALLRVDEVEFDERYIYS